MSSSTGARTRILGPRMTALLRWYARGTIFLGWLLVAVVILRHGGALDLRVLLAGVAAVALLRYFSIALSKFSYVSATFVALGALVMLGHPAAAIVAGAVGVAIGDAVQRKVLFAVWVNGAREALGVLAAVGVYFLTLRLTVPDMQLGARMDTAFAVDRLPAVVIFLLVFTVASRGLFYFSLVLRSKLTAAEWMVLFRYEVTVAALGAVGAAAAAATFLYFEPAGWVVILAFVGAAGLFSRALLIEAIGSEELRKVVAMETVIASGMSLEESLSQIAALAGRLLEWRWLNIYDVQGREMSLTFSAETGGAEALAAAEHLRRGVLESGEIAIVHDAENEIVSENGMPFRSLVVLPLTYGASTLGVLELAHHRAGVYTQAEMRLVERFGRQLALALQLDGLVRPMVRAGVEIGDQLDTLRGTAADLRQSGEGVASFAEGIVIGIDEQRSRSEKGLRSVEALVAAAAEIAEDARVSAERSRDAGALAASNRDAVGEAIDRLVELRGFVSEEARQIAELANASERASGVISAIRSVSAQTHLLALNAAIEAARAGEQGKGFAVVADEVRKLADASARAAAEADRLLGGIRTEVGAAVDRMEVGARSVAGVGEVSERASEALDRIVVAAGGAGELASRIAERVEEQRLHLSALRDEIDGLAGIGERNAPGARRVAEAANAQAAALGDIETAVTAMRGIAATLNAYMEQLKQVG